MSLVDLHTHTYFCDGANSPEDLVLSAIKKGVSVLGIVAHSYTYFDESYCLKLDRYDEFKAEVRKVGEKYKDKIKVLVGIEQDYYSSAKPVGFDFIIGSVHYLKVGEKFYPVDENEELTKKAIDEGFNGDALAYAEEYYRTISDVINKTGADVIGHFDIIAKEKAGGKFIDTTSIRYKNAVDSAIDKLIKTGKIFEINTSRIYKNLSNEPYPTTLIIKKIIEKKGKVIFSSDAHNTNMIAYKFEELEKTLKIK